jgi:hypothetical protein
MSEINLTALRLHNQGLAGARTKTPEGVVRRLGAVQAQDFPAARWALALRLPGNAGAAIEQACDAGEILRIHILRPTWHLVLPEDIRWMLALTAPRIRAAMAYNDRQFGLDEATYTRSNAVLARALQGGAQLTRPELISALEQAGIPAGTTVRSSHLLMRAELEGILCSGQVRSEQRGARQLTYALLDERAPIGRSLGGDEALAELARRYFTSRGPATVMDFTWWSGLAGSTAKAGLELVRSELAREELDGRDYWRARSSFPVAEAAPGAFLLPNFDEYLVGYADRSAALDGRTAGREMSMRAVLGNTILVGGRIAGAWKRVFKKGAVEVSLELFRELSIAEAEAVEAAVLRYGQFVGMEVHVKW